MTGSPTLFVGAAFNTIPGVAGKRLSKLIEVNLVTDKTDAFRFYVHGGQRRVAVYAVVIGFAHAHDKAAAVKKAIVSTVGVLLNFVSVNVIQFFLHQEDESRQRGLLQCFQLLAEVFADNIGQFVTKGFEQEGIVGP